VAALHNEMGNSPFGKGMQEVVQAAVALSLQEIAFQEVMPTK